MNMPIEDEIEEMNLEYLIKINSIMMIQNLIKLYDVFIWELNGINPFLKEQKKAEMSQTANKTMQKTGELNKSRAFKKAASQKKKKKKPRKKMMD